MSVMDNSELIAALRAVPGVSDADVQPDADGGLGTLRLDLEAGVDEAAVASSVGRVLREQFGLGVDADRVQVVEDAVLDAVEAPVRAALPEQRSGARPAIARMHLVSSGLDVTASVTLSSGEAQATGEARGAASHCSTAHRVTRGGASATWNASLRSRNATSEAVTRSKRRRCSVHDSSSMRST